MTHLRFLLIFIIFGCLFSAGCDPWKSDPLDFIHTITVTNATDCSLVIFLDTDSTQDLPNRNDMCVFDDVPEGAHTLTAYRFESGVPGEEVAFVEIFISERKDYYWSIINCTP